MKMYNMTSKTQNAGEGSKTKGLLFFIFVIFYINLFISIGG